MPAALPERYTAARMSLPHRDRTVALAVVGALEILAGLGLLALCAFMSLLLLDTATLESSGMKAGSLVLTVAIYGALGIAAIVVGGGLIACRRWARALSLIASWSMAILGILIALAYALLIPALMRSMPEATGSPAMPAAFITIISVAFALLVLVVPGALCAWILSGDDARLTCEWRDRHSRWTDRCPLPVLAMSLFYALGAVASLPAGFTTPSVLAGRVISGLPALAFYAIMAIVMGLLAWGLYRLRRWAFWGAMAVYVAGFVNGLFILKPGVLEELYRTMGMPEDQVRLSTNLLETPAMLAFMGLGAAGLAAWFLYIRRHFRRIPE